MAGMAEFRRCLKRKDGDNDGKLLVHPSDDTSIKPFSAGGNQRLRADHIDFDVWDPDVVAASPFMHIRKFADTIAVCPDFPALYELMHFLQNPSDHVEHSKHLVQEADKYVSKALQEGKNAQLDAGNIASNLRTATNLCVDAYKLLTKDPLGHPTFLLWTRDDHGNPILRADKDEELPTRSTSDDPDLKLPEKLRDEQFVKKLQQMEETLNTMFECVQLIGSSDQVETENTIQEARNNFVASFKAKDGVKKEDDLSFQGLLLYVCDDWVTPQVYTWRRENIPEENLKLHAGYNYTEDIAVFEDLWNAPDNGDIMISFDFSEKYQNPEYVNPGIFNIFQAEYDAFLNVPKWAEKDGNWKRVFLPYKICDEEQRFIYYWGLLPLWAIPPRGTPLEKLSRFINVTDLSNFLASLQATQPEGMFHWSDQIEKGDLGVFHVYGFGDNLELPKEKDRGYKTKLNA